MEEIADEGKTILACSHDPNDVAWFCDKVIVISNSNVLVDGEPDNALNEDVLNIIYQDSCAIRSAGGIPIVMPRTVASRMNS